MNCKKLCAVALVACVSLAAIVASMALAEPAKDAQPQLPPGFSEEDMKACIAAATPGEVHKKMAKDVGVWHGKNTMWMAPGAPPVTCETKNTLTSIMDGRYLQLEAKGEMPGMGPFHGMGIYGFDNVSQKLVATWIDNMSTGIMTGTGEMTEDGKTLTWNYTYNCPITKKPVKMREVQTVTGPNTRTIEMFGNEPKTGKEFKMMKIELTKG